MKTEIFNEKNAILAAITDGDDYRDLFKNLSNELKIDHEFALKIATIEPSVLESAPKEWKNDREIVMTAVANYEDALKFASINLQEELRGKSL